MIADNNSCSSALLNENCSSVSFWAGANIMNDDFAWDVQIEWGLFFCVLL